jgi:dipeptidyl aminopeptidase/acylaminoacyl peptidase
MSGLPVLNNLNLRQIFRDNGLDLSKNKGLLWSFDGTQLVASLSGKVYYSLETDKINLTPPQISANDLEVLKKRWQKEADIKAQSQLSKIPSPLLTIISSSAANLKFSPDETKVLYQATASATLPPPVINLPGSNPTSEIRHLKSGNIYVYDLKEDRNYEVFNVKFSISNLNWFPTSRHLVVNEGKQIAVMEYDGTNKAVVYAGPFVDNLVFVWPNWAKIIILTNLNTPAATGENLYTINLR